MKRVLVFAFLVMSGLVMTQSFKKDAKFSCLSSVINIDNEWILAQVGQNEQFSYLDNVTHMLLFYKGLTQEQRNAIDACNLNLSPAIGRCEKVHGVGNCDRVTSTFVNRKCQQNFRIEGCCQCVAGCPTGWKDNGYWCEKPTAITLTKYDSMTACTDSGKSCVAVGEKLFTQNCPEYFTRVGTNLCTARCPLGWNDQGYRCMKPGTYHVGHPFSWTLGDN